MKSHTVTFQLRDLLTLLLPPLVPVALFALALHGAAAARVLPAPRPALDFDRTVIIHQVEAARARSDVDVVLIGDSSCLMDVDTDSLSAATGLKILNLGTLSFLDLNAYGTLMKEFFATRSRPPRAVVLLMHPNTLRLGEPQRYHLEQFQHFLAGTDAFWKESPYDHVACALGLPILRGRLIARLLPSPLPGAYGRAYRFTSGLEESMTARLGSVTEVGRETLKGASEYRLAPRQEQASQNFRASVPTDVRLFAAMTPVPASLAGSDYAEVHRALLAQWIQWLNAEPLNLPAIRPDEQFGRPTHLTAAGARAYTTELAGALTAALRSPSAAK